MLTNRIQKQVCARRLLSCLALGSFLIIGDGCTTKPPARPSYQAELQSLPIGEYVLSPTLSYLTLNTPEPASRHALFSFNQFAASLDFGE